ncbi:MAG TPA: hypothetical protein VL614_00700 [Acetobacteraceae bacterium]|jgi:hypothetical protein|nr:hypothetical protein [Acetobacteraceae bacterium]
MTVVKVTGGYLRVEGVTPGHPDQGLPGIDGPVDPGYGVGIEHPDQGLPGYPGRPSHPIAPGGRPIDPGWGVEGPVDPGYGWPLPPVISHPIVPPSPGEPTHPIAPGRPVRPSHPIARPPTYPVDPDYGLPSPPSVWPQPPRPVDPGFGVPLPIGPEHPIYLPPPGVDNTLPLPPGAVWPPLPPSVTGQVMALVWIVGVGYRWTTIDTSLKPTHPITPPSTVPEPTPK